MSADHDDLLQLASQAARPALAQPRRKRGRPPRAALAEDAVVEDVQIAAAPEAVDLAVVVDLMGGGGPARPSHERRSWQLMERARAARSQGLAERALAKAQAAKGKVDAVVSFMSAQCGKLARKLGVAESRKVNEDRAGMMVRLAASPLCRGDDSLRCTQARSADVVARAATHAQQVHATRMFNLSPVGLVDAPNCETQGSRIHAMAWQWDETDQTIKAIFAAASSGERANHSRSSVQVMMQHARLVLYVHSEGKCVELEKQPFVSAELCVWWRRTQTACSRVCCNLCH